MRNIYKNACFVLFLSLFSTNLNAQIPVLEIPFIQSVDNSTQIVEGKVISKKSFWNSDYSHIYTVNTIEVYKVFKGSLNKELQVVTWGGKVNDMSEVVNPSLDLYKNDIGVFFLKTKDLKLVNENSVQEYLMPYGSIQGFYRYNLSANLAANVFNRVENIESSFYEKITDVTKESIREIGLFNVQEEVLRIASNTDTRAITSISPTTASAGTETLLTINGDNFLNFTGRVSFPFTNDGGASYVDAFESQIVSWSDTQILVYIPSAAGTGAVRVTTISGSEFFSDDLTINYAHITDKDSNNNPTEEYLTNLPGDNGNGGITWIYNNEFSVNAPARNSFMRAFDNWVCNSGVNWDIQGITAIGSPALDGNNIISFDLGDDLGPGTLAAAFFYLFDCGSGDDIRSFQGEVDIIFDPDRDWNYGPDQTVDSEFDFETVAVHELGHALLLAHIIDPGAIMHYASSPQNEARVLEENDITGASAVVNRSINDPVCNQPPMAQSACSLSTDDLITESISVYPNPANNILTVRTTNAISLETLSLIDIQGRLVLKRNGFNNSQENTISLINLNAGVYFVQLKTDQGSTTRKIIIE